jgi:hypothetical protein
MKKALAVATVCSCVLAFGLPAQAADEMMVYHPELAMNASASAVPADPAPVVKVKAKKKKKHVKKAAATAAVVVAAPAVVPSAPLAVPQVEAGTEPAVQREYSLYAGAPERSWSGFYVGGSIGAHVGQSRVETNPVNDPLNAYFSTNNLIAVGNAGIQRVAHNGLIAGAHTGYNYQCGHVVMGIELGIDSFNSKESSTTSGIYPANPANTFTIKQQVGTDWLLTVLPRVG